jgi:hypothetical protein
LERYAPALHAKPASTNAAGRRESGTWSAASAYRRETGDDPLSLVIADLRAAWGRPENRRPVKWDLTVRAGRLAARDGAGDS